MSHHAHHPSHPRVTVSERLRVRAKDGVALHAEIVGQGPPMLLLNGLFCSTHYWPHFVEHFSQTHSVIIFDYRGHGRSERAPHPDQAGIETLTGDALAVLDALTKEPAVIVGHSMGVRVALEIAAQRPNQVSSAVLLCGNAWMLGDHPLYRALEMLASGTLQAAARLGPVTRALRFLGTEPSLFGTVATLLGGMGPRTPRDPVDALVRNVRSLDVRLMMALARGYLAHDGRALLARVRAPSLQIVGEIDRLAPPSHAARIAELLPGIRTTVLPGCTHLAPVEQPLEVHRAVRAFLRELEK